MCMLSYSVYFSYYTIFICSMLLLRVDLQCLHCDVFITSTLISTQPHLNVISGGRRQLFQEPRRRVPGAAGVVLTTPFSIPERIGWIEDVLKVTFTSCVTKVVMSHKWRNCRELSVACVCTWTYIMPPSAMLMKCCSKCPNVFARTSMC